MSEIDEMNIHTEAYTILQGRSVACMLGSVQEPSKSHTYKARAGANKTYYCDTNAEHKIRKPTPSQPK